jgi:citrate lyase subunit beta/citryl-CoA lyase
MEGSEPVWRSLMFVPVTNAKFVGGAGRHGADGIILDLEDSIPPGEKAGARRLVRDAARAIRATGPDVLVRVNQPLRLIAEDLEATVSPDVAAIVLPKTLGAEHLVLVDELVGGIEERQRLKLGHTKIIAMIETAGAISRMHEIAAAQRVIGLIVGGEDLSFALGMEPTPDGLYVPNVLAVAAARAAGKLPFGYAGSVALIDDLSTYRVIVRRAAELGFVGGFCIHPAQVPVLNEEFAPKAADITAAREIVAAFAKATAEGSGVFRHRGRMIDRPVVARAEALLSRAALIAEKSARSG